MPTAAARPPRLVLVRHGRSAHVHRGGWVNAEGLAAWLAAYEAAEIDADAAPPAALVAEAARAAVVAASDAPRAVASAARLAHPGRAVEVSALLREADLPVPRWISWRMPLGAWAVAIGLESLRGARGVPAASGAAPDRAGSAADWLATLAAERGDVVAVTHGAFRRQLATALVARGWRPVAGRRSYRHWSAWRFDAPMR